MARRDFGNPPILASAGKQTNAADQTVHADIGEQLAGFYECRIALGGSVAVVWQVQRRNAANSANVSPTPLTFYTAAGQTAEYVLLLELAASERIRVTNDGVLAGTSAAAIQAERLT